MGFINQFPYSDFHEMNLDWLIKQTKASMDAITALQEEMAKIEVLTEEQINAMINAAIASNNIQVYNALNNLKTQLTTEYQAYVTNQINLLTVYVNNQDVYYDNLAKSYADSALIEAKAYTDQSVLDYTMMINPINGEYQDVRVVINDIFNNFLTNDALTAAEYDALDLTAQAYDNYELTAYEYDFSGKTLLV